MFRAILVAVFSVKLCFAQDQLTCLRTRDTFQLAAPSGIPAPSSASLRRRTGKQGPIGPKGEPGIPDNSIINRLEARINALEAQIQRIEEEHDDDKRDLQNNITAITTDLQSSERNGWFRPQLRYEYKLTNSRGTWQESRSACRAMGGDLIVNGAKDFNKRRVIGRAVMRPRSIDYVWIGFNDLDEVSAYMWVDGTVCNSANIHWRAGEPNRAGRQRCGSIFGHEREYMSDDGICSYDGAFGLCEKMIG